MQPSGPSHSHSSRTDQILQRCAHAALLFIALAVFVSVLIHAKTILAPLTLAVIVGIVFGPLADRIEAFRMPAWVSAIMAVFILLVIITVAIAGFAVPLSEWMDRLPLIWSRLQTELANWQGLIASITSLQEQLSEFAGNKTTSMTVKVDDTSTVTQVAYLAPSLAAQIILFLAGFFFFTATRHTMRQAIISKLNKGHRRRKLSHMFLKIEKQVSSYMLHITGINLLLAGVVTLAMWMIGVPSPILWGLLAGVLNFVIYIGPAVMVCIMLAVGLSISSQFSAIITPAAIYLFINFMEAQFVTPLLLGRVMIINPFVIFLSLVFWIWLWGPIGGFVAVPILMICMTLLKNISLISSVPPSKAVER